MVTGVQTCALPISNDSYLCLAAGWVHAQPEPLTYTYAQFRNAANITVRDTIIYVDSLLNATLNASAATFNIPVVAGWNLISTPLDGATALPAALEDRNGDTWWDRVQYYDPSTPTHTWKQYYRGWNGALNDLTAADHTKGLWVYVNATGDGFISVGGSGYTNSTNATITLSAGWNLVGYPAINDTAYTVGNLMAATAATIVEGFDANATYRTAPLAAATVMKRGRAYWVYTPSATAWWVNW
jgi:hypothetical protein